MPTTAPVALALTLPLPPGVNNQYVTVGRRRVLSKAAQAFNRDVARTVERARRDGALLPATETALRDALLGVCLTFYFETPFRRDLDGGLKIALDALCHALALDDRAVVDLHLTKRIDPLRPRLELELDAIPDWRFDRDYVYLGEAPTPAHAGRRHPEGTRPDSGGGYDDGLPAPDFGGGVGGGGQTAARLVPPPGFAAQSGRRPRGEREERHRR